jgi:hypothetical protein
MVQITGTRRVKFGMEIEHKHMHYVWNIVCKWRARNVTREPILRLCSTCCVDEICTEVTGSQQQSNGGGDICNIFAVACSKNLPFLEFDVLTIYT